MNHYSCSGNLGVDPEYRVTKNGNPMCTFSIAVMSRNRKETNWFDCVAFGNTADLINKYCKKGSHIIVEDGELKQDRWEKDGQKRSKVKLTVHRLELGPKAKKQDNDDDADTMPFAADANETF